LAVFVSFGWVLTHQPGKGQTPAVHLEEDVRAASLYLETERPSYGLGEAFNLQVKVRTAGQKEETIDGVEFILNYDPRLVQIGEPLPGDFFSLYPQKKVNPERGQVRLVALQSFQESKTLVEETVVFLPVMPLQKGELEFSFVKERSHLAAYGGQDILQEAPSLLIKLE